MADVSYFLIDLLAGDGRHRRQNWPVGPIAGCVCDRARHDPGSRILVVLNVQYCHHVRAHLRQEPELAVVHYREL